MKATTSVCTSNQQLVGARFSGVVWLSVTFSCIPATVNTQNMDSLLSVQQIEDKQVLGRTRNRRNK